LPSRVAMLGRDASVIYRAGGVDAARAMARQRSGGAHDPALVESLLAAGPQLFDGLNTVGWDEALAAEPGPRPLLSPTELRPARPASPAAITPLSPARRVWPWPPRAACASTPTFAARRPPPCDVTRSSARPRPRRLSFSAETAAAQLRAEARSGQIAPQSVT